MAALQAATTRHKPHSASPEPRRFWLARHWDALALLAVLLATFPPIWASHRMLAVVRDTSLIDDNWHLDEAFKLSRGLWVGRDVAFTHGPLFQWLSSLPALTMGVSMGAIYATWFIVPVWCAFVFAYVALRLLLPEQPAWKRAVLLVLLCVYWAPALRTMLPVLLFALFVRGCYGLIERRVASYTVGVLAGLLCVVSFLVAGDSGTYAIAAWLTALAGVAIEHRRQRAALLSLAAALAASIAAFAGSAFIVGAVLARPGFHFWRDTATMISVYRWATSSAMPDAGTLRWFGTLLGGAAIFIVRGVLRPKQPAAVTQRSGFLLGGFAFALAMMQSGLVRSDYGHVVIACFAMTFLCGTILFSYESRRGLAIAILLSIGASLVLSQPAIRPSKVTRLVQQLQDPLTECPAGFHEFDRACFHANFTEMLQAAAGYLQQHSSPQGPIVVFPYQTMFGLVSGRNVAGGLMQPYTASGPYLSQLEIAALERAAAPAGLYLPDADLRYFSLVDLNHWRNLDLSLPVDGVSNFTRTPEVWFWLLRHYRSGPQLSAGVFGLERDDTRTARLALSEHSLALNPQEFPVRERSSTVDLGAPLWPEGADFIRLRLTVHYNFLWKLRKPERLQLEITRADGASDLQWFVLQPNASTEVWFYPWNPPNLVHYFAPDPQKWRPNPRPAVTRLRLVISPLDWVSQRVSSVVLESADAVTVTLNQ